MVVPRLLVYGTLVVLATLVLLDTNVGWSLSPRRNAAIESTAAYLDEHGFHSESDAVGRMIPGSLFRTSRFFANLGQIAAARGANFDYYAYTPILSQTRIFIGSSFWDVGDVGRSSILIHELAHIERHSSRPLRGLRRGPDEAQAYERQYLTHRAIGLSPSCSDCTVYWDMMVGINTYVLPIKPSYARKPDIIAASRMSAQEEETYSMMDVAIIIGYFISALLLLVAGDRLGAYVACSVFGRCSRAPLLQLGPWVLPIALLIPTLILLGFLTVCMRTHPRSAIEVLADNLEFIVLATFFLTGLAGGFFTHTRH